MFVLGLQGSPRKKGNSEYLLNTFLAACEDRGAETELVRTDKLDIQPCKELIVCEKKGYCPLKDEMEPGFYGKIRRADVVVVASPVFFYGVSAQVKIFIDRCQMFWGRKYKLGLRDPDAANRKGVLLSVAASGGKRLFEGVELTAKYFFDAISADFAESLTYKKVEAAGAIRDVPGVDDDILAAADRVVTKIRNRPTLLFVSRQDAGRSQMAAAFAKAAASGSVRVLSAGVEPAPDIAPGVETYMADQGLDIKYQLPKPLAQVLAGNRDGLPPVRIISLDADGVDGAEAWRLAAPFDPGDAASVARAGEEMRDRVTALVGDMTAG